jgi:hypothetical protein
LGQVRSQPRRRPITFEDNACLTHPAKTIRVAGRPLPPPNSADSMPSTRQEELRSFLFFTVVMARARRAADREPALLWLAHVIAASPGI